MGVLLVVLSTLYLFGLLVTLLVKKLRKKQISRKFWIMTLVTFLVAITAISFAGNPESTMYERITIWTLALTISSFIAVLVSIAKYNSRIVYITSGILTGVYLIAIISTIVFQGWELVFNYYIVMYKISLLIFLIIFIIKKNILAVINAKVLLGIHVVHLFTRAFVYYKDTASTIIEIILFSLISLAIAYPIYRSIKKRVLANKEVDSNMKADNSGDADTSDGSDLGELID